MPYVFPHFYDEVIARQYFNTWERQLEWRQCLIRVVMRNQGNSIKSARSTYGAYIVAPARLFDKRFTDGLFLVPGSSCDAFSETFCICGKGSILRDAFVISRPSFAKR